MSQSELKLSHAPTDEVTNEILTDDAKAFLVHLQKKFNKRRQDLLHKRRGRQQRLNQGEAFGFLSETAHIRGGDWQVAEAAVDLNDRRTEITGPVEAKMMINALNSGAKVFMADLEDSCSPTWENVTTGQLNLKRAVRRELTFTNPDGKEYKLGETLATLVVRPRGWHLEEEHAHVDGEAMSASLFDFGLYFFHNAHKTLENGSGPYFYLPKMESHLEARLWNDVFCEAQSYLDIPQGTIRATVLIETLPAAFEMEEILYELRDHSAGLNAGRWDYIFSLIKRMQTDASKILPDRAQVTMEVPFMRAYTNLLVKSCHTHGAHAIGGMAAYIPSRRDPVVNEKALQAVTADKMREAHDGFDGTWVAHPDLVPTALNVFDAKLGASPHQKHIKREDVSVTADQLVTTAVSGGKITQAGFDNNVSVAIQYIAYWLGGLGAVALNNLMEDAATAEISRAQLWQWVHHQAKLDDGTAVTAELYQETRARIEKELEGNQIPHLKTACRLLDELVLSEDFAEFLTLGGYNVLTQ